jgi:hypothetical protein
VGFKQGTHDCGGSGGGDGQSGNTSGEDRAVVLSFVVGLMGVRRGGSPFPLPCPSSRPVLLNSS